jgi:hypothetical protein
LNGRAVTAISQHDLEPLLSQRFASGALCLRHSVRVHDQHIVGFKLQALRRELRSLQKPEGRPMGNLNGRSYIHCLSTEPPSVSFCGTGFSGAAPTVGSGGAGVSTAAVGGSLAGVRPIRLVRSHQSIEKLQTALPGPPAYSTGDGN